jgi:hypothetical protein
MENLYQWTIANPFVWGIVTSVLGIVLGFIFAPGKFIKYGFTVSQFVRHIFGAKIEKEFEQAIDDFDKGLHGDDETPGA